VGPSFASKEKADQYLQKLLAKNAKKASRSKGKKAS
jgi:hypothetical protein